MNPSVDVVEDGLDQGGVALEEEVLGVGAPQARAQQDSAADPDEDPVDRDPVAGGVRGLVARRVPPGGIGLEHRFLLP
ncbi:hypothetical protein GCM10020254_77010 [Streptomyces goshikiensis]